MEAIRNGLLNLIKMHEDDQTPESANAIQDYRKTVDEINQFLENTKERR